MARGNTSSVFCVETVNGKILARQVERRLIRTREDGSRYVLVEFIEHDLNDKNEYILDLQRSKK